MPLYLGKLENINAFLLIRKWELIKMVSSMAI